MKPYSQNSKTKISVCLLFGGQSAEHEVSLLSAKNINAALDKNKFNTILVAIDKSGNWLLPDQNNFLLHSDDPKKVSINTKNAIDGAFLPNSTGSLTSRLNPNLKLRADVVFPILHGPLGEDGTIQGLLTLAGVPFVGSGVLGSAAGMDKDVMKRLLRDVGVPIGKFITCIDPNELKYDQVVKKLGSPVFIKPANMGSSVGVSKAKNKQEFDTAVSLAFQHDTKILIEAFVPGRELECAVLGNKNPEASCVGEVAPTHDFYSYDAKYIDENGAALTIPADISKSVSEKARALAIQTFTSLGCRGLGRVDFFLKEDGTLVVNEINTMPGFTKISMYPQLWQYSGINYTELITRLIRLAMEK